MPGKCEKRSSESYPETFKYKEVKNSKRYHSSQFALNVKHFKILRPNGTLEKFASVTTDKMKIDQALARAVFVTGVLFSIFEKPYWKLAMSLMRPSYESPSAYQISNPLLNSEYDQVMQSVKSKIKAVWV
ncbi:hypothetical protein RF55_15026 [Lasius niger]|uniref:Uncharacterized protein n=1 Tax=Lasius niger TaxID=67767 RepID=A0A0J7K7E5_LASNI|nr:hypothetical protein RF55_15026 [Lasius niger]